MRVGIDVQLAVGTSTGIGEYARGLARELARAELARVVELSAPRVDPWRFDRRVIWDQLVLPLQARRARVELVHCTSGTMPLALGLPAVVTVHDVAWLRVQAHARPYARAYFGAFQLARYARARAISLDSAFSRDELIAVAPQLDPAKMHVVYPGVDDAYATLARRPDEAPFVLVPGTVEPRKNLLLAIEALPSLPGVRLVSVGPPTPYLERCRARANELGVSERIEFRGYVPFATLLDLHARAALVAVPSTYEGFGYAAAQALCAGIPLVSSRASSLSEVVGNAWPVHDPHDAAAFAAAMAAILADRAAAEATAAAARAEASARFAWSRAARKTVELYRLALER